MSFGGKVLNVDKFLKKAEKAADIFELNRNNAVKEGTLAIHSAAIKIVSENEGGSRDVRYNPKRNVTVSKPGNPPHTDTGRLRQSIKFNYKNGQGEVGSNYKVAAGLEFGTENMAPRPWLSKAVTEVSKDIGNIFEKWFKKAVKEISK